MQTNHRRETLLLGTLFVWVLFVLFGYYYWHKPINVEMVVPPLNAAIDMLFVLLFVGLAGGLGRLALRSKGRSALEYCVVEFALGAGIISFAWFALGLLGLYRLPLGLPLLALGLLAVRRPALAWFSSLGALGQIWRETDKLEKALALISAALLLFQLLIALSPPIKWDALAYHLQLPRQYLEAGRFFFTPENPYWGHPQLVEMLYTFAISLHRVETAAVLGWSAGVLFLLGLFGFTNSQLARIQGQRAITNSAGWMAITAVMAGATFRELLAWSYTDLFSALFGLAALIVCFDWFHTRSTAAFWLAAIFSGLAMGTKWTAGVLALSLMSAGLLWGRKYGLSRKNWLIAGLLIVLAVLPWLVKNLAYTGSPIYPYFFGTAWIDSARIASANPPVEGVAWWMRAFLPLTTTFTGIDSADGFSADLGPLLLLLGLPGFIRGWRDDRVKSLGILLGFTALGMGAASLRLGHLMQTRLYYVALPAVAVSAGWGWEWLQAQVLQGVRMRRIISAVILLVMGMVLWQDSYLTARLSPLDVLTGTKTRTQYLENSIGYTSRAMDRLKSLPEDAHTLMLWEPRGLYAPLNAQADLWIDRWRTDRRELEHAPTILERWKHEGFTHALLYQPGADLIKPQSGQPASPDWTELQALLALLPAPESIGDFYLLYRLN